MTKNIIIAVAWPYANSEIHVGNITGSYLPADITARYHRLIGNDVIMVSGSDSHGTPVTVRADAEGVPPEEVYKRFHQGFLDLFKKLGLSYDLFTSTHTENHFKVSQTLFQALLKNEHLYAEKQKQWFSPSLNRFLPDRYVEGTCYICGYEGARGDQCDQCGSLLDSVQLLDPKSKIDGSRPDLRETEHFYLDLGGLQEAVVDFLESKEENWRPNVMRQSLGQIRADKLRGRAITRDLEWGVPVPVDGWEGKCLYVWFEAVMGYLSATIEWSKLSGDPDSWRKWWTDENALSYYFIGKDNIPFHAVIWPAELIGAGESFSRLFDGRSGDKLILPYDVPANEFLNLEGRKISGSRNWAVWGLDFLERYDPDALRYYLTANMPVNKDTDWDWDDFIRRNNDELVANWGNLANRVLSFAYKNWDGFVPAPEELRPEDHAIIDQVEQGFEKVGTLFEKVRLRSALNEALRISSEVNKYLDTKAPWFEIKTDKESAGKTIYTALKVIDSLKIIFAPFLPFSSEKLNQILGYDHPIFGDQFTEEITDNLGVHEVLRYDPKDSIGKWEPSQLEPGKKLLEPSPLFKKLDAELAVEERARLGKPATGD